MPGWVETVIWVAAAVAAVTALGRFLWKLVLHSPEATAPPGSSPSLVEAYANANRQQREFRAFAEPLLRPEDCDAAPTRP